MGTIVKRKNADGSYSYRVDIRFHQDNVLVFRRTKTFSDRREALEWMLTIEKKWKSEDFIEKPPHTVADVIARYIDRRDALKPLGRTSRALLQAIARSPFGTLRAADVSERDIIGLCETRRADGAGPATVMLDFVSLQTMYGEARPLLGLHLSDDVFKASRPRLIRLGLIGKPKQRKRRLQADELDRLLTHCRKRERHAASLIPLADIVEFALYSCMRLGEVCRILWTDLDEQRRTVVIRDRKSPQAKAGNNQTVPLLGPAFSVVERQPRTAARIFPYDARSVSTAFTRICAALFIPDLHFHDLRREGATRLLEMGYSVPEVATVTGHRDLNILWQVYTAIQPEHLHEKYRNESPG